MHGHFYQPERRDPFTGEVAPQPAAAPFRDWNARIDAECYKPNAERGNLGHISYDLGPTLASWLGEHDKPVHDLFIASDLPSRNGTGSAAKTAPKRRSEPAGARPFASGNAMAQAYHHSIMPLASLMDRRTEIRWGLRDFELRYGRRATGIWLPETAVDLPTLRICVDEGVRYTILAPWQGVDSRLDTRRPYRVELGEGKAITIVFYDGTLSSAASFDSGATMNADYFARDHVVPRMAGQLSDGEAPLVLIATDGELYGHHQKFRDLFLARLANPGSDVPDRGFDVVTLGEVLGAADPGEFPVTQISERTSWSCHHGVLRWYAECPDASDGRWKGPLRVALERLAAGMDVVVARRVASDFMAAADFWRARDDYVDLLFGATTETEFAARWLPKASDDQRRSFLTLLEAEHWRLAMFASDGWFWGDPIRPETKQVLLCAARSARLVDELAGTALEARLLDDLSLFTSPSRRIDGAGIYREALTEAGQPLP